MSSRPSIIGAIIVKDLKEFTRDRFYLFMAILGLVFYVAIFWLLPSDVDETITVGVVGAAPFDFSPLAAGEGSEGVAIVEYENVEELVAAIEAGDDDVAVGMAFPSELGTPVIEVFIGPDVPPSWEGAVVGMASEIAYAAVDIPPPVSGFATEEFVLGEDRVGDQASLQDKFAPLLAFLILVVEMLSLAGLVASEIQDKTVKAITVTPARISDFLAAKALFGTALAFVQVAVLIAAIGGLATAPGLLLTALLLGSVLVTGFGLLAGSIGKDFVGILFWSMLIFIPLLIPAMALLFPGSTATWIKVVPSWPLAQVLVDVTTAGAGWAEAVPLLGLLALWGAGALAVGWLVLSRKVQTL